MTPISACIIVKNEAKRICDLLECLSDVEDIVIIDTGSTDNTKAMIRGHRLAERITLADFPWCDDFSAARNEAAKRAKHEWTLVLDADMTLDPSLPKTLLDSLKNMPPTIDCLELRVVFQNNGTSFHAPRFVKKDRLHKYRVHEIPEFKQHMRTNYLLLTSREETTVERNAKDDYYEKILEKELAEDPCSTHALGYLRDINFIRKDFGRAKSYIDRLLLLNPEDYLCHYEMASILKQDEEYDSALRSAFTALSYCPSDPRIYNLIGNLYDKLERIPQAILFYGHAANLPPEAKLIGTMTACSSDEYDVIPLINMANLFSRIGRLDKVKENLTRALTFAENSSNKPKIIKALESLAALESAKEVAERAVGKS